MRLSILSNVNLDMLSGLLKKENEVFQTDGYGEWITYALKKDERLAAFAPECLFLLLDGNALLEGCQDMGSVKTVLDRSEQYIAVSYTHLDVYKRQECLNTEEAEHMKK